ncbi:sodium:proton antiporter [Escherichia coli]|uniref:Na+/H+ antiporter NhaC family protein n=1 Tax=Escherichia coli TaxID=562 RepID=UPI001EFC44D3|nr:Na+/H+ antiporter NhaC family protein [Escherichia coli]MCG9390909.1 sodium:proton antiporter [Escherichia coli]MCG9400041.1 sodium:proton antiporter [Escherichia coli]MCG9452204.1 sodium:proton antiporter [Escherichia coli]MCG9457021.1 sodium:proton antiporter [Escherichia coli]
MHDYGIWTVITPLVTIILAIVTRQVILSLLTGIFVGYAVIHNSIIQGIGGTLNGIIETFASPGNARTVVFMIMIGGIMRLIVVTGGVRKLVQYLSEKNDYVTNKKSVQLLAMIITSLIFIESSINQLIAGASTKNLAKRYRVSPEKMSYIIQTSCVSVCSSVMINGWGAAMMGVIGVQIAQGYLTGEPFEILANSMVWNTMAWFSLASVLFYIFSGFSWGPMKKAEVKFDTCLADLENEQQDDSNDEVIDHPAANSLLNFFIPILSTVLMVPVALYVTGDGQFSKGSGSMSVYSGVMFGTVVSFVWFRLRGILNVEAFFKELYLGYAGMIKISSIMVLAFLMGHISAELNTGQYIASVTSGVMPAGVSIGFIFLVSAIMSLATGTSWGTFAIMIPIGVQLGVSLGIPPHFMIGAAISGSIFGDMTSPISSDAIVASMATNCDHIEHIRTQMPYALVTGSVVLLVYIILGFSL